MKEHRLPIKIYLEDTDAQGIVYHANYLKFFERARTEILSDLGGSPLRIDDKAIRFVVHEMQIKFSRPASLGESLEVRSNGARLSEFRVAFEQAVHRPGDEKPLVRATVQIVCINPAGQLTPLPDGFLTD